MKSLFSRSIFCAALIAGLAAPAWAADGQVASLLGTAIAQRGDQTIALKPGDAISARDTITTGRDSIVRFRMSDESYFAMPANSSLRIDEYALPKKAESKNARAFYSLLKGGFRTVTGLLGKIRNDSYKVVTPVATLGVRGTEYMVNFTPPLTDAAGKVLQMGQFALTVISGRVSVTTTVNGVTTTIEVNEGESITIDVGIGTDGNPIATSAPVLSKDMPEVFTSGQSGGDLDIGADGATGVAVYAIDNPVDLPSPGEISAPNVPGAGTPGRPKIPPTPGLPVPPRIEPPLPPRDAPASPS